MAIYAVGDIQGCLSPLRCLLDQANFDPNDDQLWCAGDLVNRGPESLATLRFIKSLGPSATVVLGNHDLHLLAGATNPTQIRGKDTFKEILEAEDRNELLQWLARQKLIHLSDDQQFILVHAGIPPIWSLMEAAKYAREIEAVLQSDQAELFFQHMYGNQPDCWDDSLTGPNRWRVITNYLTRMRFCDSQGRLELDCSLGPDHTPPGYRAWFQLPHQFLPNQTVLFGHWAALNGKTGDSQFIALDTGCVWGRQLSMLRLEDRTWFRCNC